VPSHTVSSDFSLWGVSVCVLCGSPMWPSPPVVGPLWGPPLCVGPLCGSPVRVPCVGPLCGSLLCGSPVWVRRRAASSCIYSRDASRSFTRSRLPLACQLACRCCVFFVNVNTFPRFLLLEFACSSRTQRYYAPPTSLLRAAQHHYYAPPWKACPPRLRSALRFGTSIACPTTNVAPLN